MHLVKQTRRYIQNFAYASSSVNKMHCITFMDGITCIAHNEFKIKLLNTKRQGTFPAAVLYPSKDSGAEKR